MQSIDENEFSFSLETGFITNQKIPSITLIPKSSKNKKLPAVLFLHGFDTSKEKVLRYGMHLTGAGFYTVLVDLPDHGDRVTADFNEKYNLKNEMKKSWFNRLVLFKKSLDEIKLITDFCSVDPKIDSNRFGISGISMGATLSLLTSYKDPRIKAAASFLSILGYDSIPGLNDYSDIPDQEKKIYCIIGPAVCDQ